MFGEFFRFDLRYQLRTPLLWIAAFLFGVSRIRDQLRPVQIGGAIGNVHRNAPMVLVNMFDYFTVLGMFAVTAFVANAVLRDFELGTSELFFATPMKKSHYLFGRFAAGIVARSRSTSCSRVDDAGRHASGLDPARVGPFSPTPTSTACSWW
jgi:ABC-type transport system involved in multi-copper enzyme maturation permease subunit